MMCSDSDPQMGRSDWTQRMMMNMPATNISPSATPPPPPSASSSSSAVAKAAVTQQHPSQQQEQRPSGPLRCPRCDSANTKFCYYNNYSLSQPRHFCKACKRYWTRGGTLRNVPVGGGCRKNKRVKKHHSLPATTTVTATASATVTATNTDSLPPPPPPPPPLLPTSSDLSSFFYGLTTSDMNFPGTAAAYDALGLGGLIPASNQLMNNNLADLQHQQPSSSSFLHHNEYPSSFGSQAASLFMSSLKQPKKAEDQYGQSLLPYDSANLGFLKDVKVEGDRNNHLNLMPNNISTEWQAGGYPFGANINGAADASFLYWNPVMGGAAGWPDAANSSVAPLI